MVLRVWVCGGIRTAGCRTSVSKGKAVTMTVEAGCPSCGESTSSAHQRTSHASGTWGSMGRCRGAAQEASVLLRNRGIEAAFYEHIPAAAVELAKGPVRLIGRWVSTSNASAGVLRGKGNQAFRTRQVSRGLWDAASSRRAGPRRSPRSALAPTDRLRLRRRNAEQRRHRDGP